jgi:hypothetical protein
MERELTLRIVVESPPEGVDYGLQKGRGSFYETVEKQRSRGKDLTFQFNVALKTPGKATAATWPVLLCRARKGSGSSTSTSVPLRDRWIHAGADV